MKQYCFLLLALLPILSCSKKKAETDPGSWHVRYEVTDDVAGAQATIYYSDATGNEVYVGGAQASYVTLPWTLEFDRSKADGVSRELILRAYSASAGTTRCRIFVDGQLAAEAPIYGQYTLP